MPVTELDARRLLCPMPVIRCQEAIKTLSPGDQLKIVATDPGTEQDIAAWCRVHGHRLDEFSEVDYEYHFLITVQA